MPELSPPTTSSERRRCFPESEVLLRPSVLSEPCRSNFERSATPGATSEQDTRRTWPLTRRTPTRTRSRLAFRPTAAFSGASRNRSRAAAAARTQRQRRRRPRRATGFQTESAASAAPGWPPARRAQPVLAIAHRRPRHHQSGDIRTCDQQHESDGSQQQDQQRRLVVSGSDVA